MLLQLLDRARTHLPPDTDTGFFAEFIENNEYGLAWKELAATGNNTAVGSDFWNIMADAARLLGMGIEARNARNWANSGGEVAIMLPTAEAIVLLEFLNRADADAKRDEDHAMNVQHCAERHALAYLLNVLEYGLLDPALPQYLTLLHHGRDPHWPDYIALVESARSEVECEWDVNDA